MSPADAAQVLELPASVTPEQVEARYFELQSKLEDKIARAPTEGLKVKYREGLLRASEARDVLLKASATDLLPARTRTPLATNKAEPAVVPPPAMEVAIKPGPRRRWPWRRLLIAGAGTFVALGALTAWFLLADSNRSLREHLASQWRHRAYAWAEQKSDLIATTKLALGWDDTTPVPLDQRSSEFTATSELYLAVLYNERTRVAELLATGENPLEGTQLIDGHMDAGFSTPVAAALGAGRLIFARELLRYSPKPTPADPQSITNFQFTFEQICGTGNWAAIQVLLDFHPPVWTTSAWDYLLNNGDAKLLELAVRAGADPNLRNENQETALHRAARFYPSPDLLTTLIRLGADPRARDDEGVTPLDLLDPETASQVMSAPR